MRIGVVTTSYPRFAGDFAGGFVAEHAARLREAGHEVEVVCAGDGSHELDPLVTRTHAPGLFYGSGAPEALEATPAAWLHGLGFAAKTSAKLMRRKWDAMVGHWLIPATMAAVAKPMTPLIAIAHSGDVDLLCRHRLASPVAAILRAHGAKLSFVAEHLRRRFAAAASRPLRSWIERAQVTPMGIEVQRFASIERRRRQRPHVVFLGRLVPIKGVSVVIDALTELCSLADVTLAGDGPLRDRVHSAARRAGARYLGPAHGAARDRLLADADVVILPSLPQGERCEGFPVTALEAMAAGACVIAARTGGLAELPEQTATMIEPGNARELTSAVRAVLDDSDLRERQRRAALEYAATFDWAQVATRLEPPQASRVRNALRTSA